MPGGLPLHCGAERRCMLVSIQVCPHKVVCCLHTKAIPPIFTMKTRTSQVVCAQAQLRDSSIEDHDVYGTCDIAQT